MINWPILSLTIFLPVFGIFIILFIKTDKKNYENNVKKSALLTSLGTLFLSILIWIFFDSTIIGYQFIEKRQWINNLESQC